MALYAAPSESDPLLNGQRAGSSSDGEDEKDSCWKRFEARKPSAAKAANDTQGTASTSTTAEESARKAEYLEMTVDQLRRRCDDARLSDAGSKEELVARLVDSANADSSKP